MYDHALDNSPDDTETRENGLAFLLRTAPPERPAAGSAARKLEVMAFVGEEVVDVRHVDGSKPVTLGSADVDPTNPTLVQVGTGDGPQLLHDARGWVFLPTFDMVAFIDTCADEPERRLVTGETVLSPGDRLLVEVGPLIYVVQEVQPGKRVPNAPVQLDTPMLSLLSFLGISAGVFGYALGTVPPPPQTSLLSLVDQGQVINLARVVPPPPAPRKAAAGGSSAHRGPPGRAGKGQPKPQGAPSDRDRAMQALKGLDAVFKTIGDATLNVGIQNGASGLRQGRPTGNGPGLGDRGEGLGGPGVADGIGAVLVGHGDDAYAVAHGGPGTGHQDGAIVSTGDVISLGSLGRDEIDRVIKRNMASIRYCYQKDLQVHPGIGGKVTMKFTIAADGSVSSATSRPTNPMPAVEACLTSRFMSMKFPEPKGGGLVVVSYPFVFSAG